MILTGRSTKMLVSLAVCALLLVAPAVAHADTIFSNLGPGNSYNISLGNPVGDGLDGSGLNYAEGDRFTAGLTASLNSVMLALSCAVCPGGGSLTVRLTQNAGNQPGAVLESLSVLGTTLGILGNNNPVITLSSVLHPILSFGTEYWLTVSGPATSAVAWNWNTTGDGSPTAISGDGGASWFSPAGLTPGAYGLNGTAVPEPGTVWLFATGFLTLGGVKLRSLRKRNSGNLPRD